ncbi:hypothetical protein L596_015584 [Steinernema carpocapsae]|uniref:Uncharacterized protein n=1 Tax=Steinernema carpocapsae TaxID=34508 RepID=A0A4U5NGN6_STECR|nr:hypothetical protein L596_015584 [Steinernema carpocapsae]
MNSTWETLSGHLRRHLQNSKSWTVEASQLLRLLPIFEDVDDWCLFAFFVVPIPLVLFVFSIFRIRSSKRAFEESRIAKARRQETEKQFQQKAAALKHRVSEGSETKKFKSLFQEERAKLKAAEDRIRELEKISLEREEEKNCAEESSQMLKEEVAVLKEKARNQAEELLALAQDKIELENTVKDLDEKAKSSFRVASRSSGWSEVDGWELDGTLEMAKLRCQARTLEKYFEETLQKLTEAETALAMAVDENAKLSKKIERKTLELELRSENSIKTGELLSLYTESERSRKSLEVEKRQLEKEVRALERRVWQLGHLKRELAGGSRSDGEVFFYPPPSVTIPTNPEPEECENRPVRRLWTRSADENEPEAHVLPAPLFRTQITEDFNGGCVNSHIPDTPSQQGRSCIPRKAASSVNVSIASQRQPKGYPMGYSFPPRPSFGYSGPTAMSSPPPEKPLFPGVHPSGHY